jgi:hypothetical protein
MLRLRALVACAFGLASMPVTSEAAQRTSSLSWVRLPGAETCIGTRALAEAVERRLRRGVFVSAAQADVSVEGRIERNSDPQGFHAVITLSSLTGIILGTRELRSTAASCDAMNEELELVIAVMIDPEAALSPAVPPAPLPSPAPSPPRVVIERVPVPVPARPAARPEPWHAGVEVGAMTSFGLLPNPGAAIVLRGRIRPPELWAIELGAFLWRQSEAREGVLGARFRMAEAFLDVCPLTLKAFGAELSTCLGARIGSIRAGGFGFYLDDENEELVLSAVLGGRISRRIVGPLLVSGGLGLVVPFIRDRFFYRDSEANSVGVFQMSPVAGSLDAGLGIEF